MGENEDDLLVAEDARYYEYCECCKKLDDIEFMHNRPDGYYCDDCYQDIFN